MADDRDYLPKFAVLDASNYFEWSMNMEGQLTVKRVWHVVKPGNIVLDWHASEIAKSMMLLAVSTPYKMPIKMADSAQNAWIMLRDMNRHSIEAQIMQKRDQLYNLRKLNTECVMELHSRARTLAHELELAGNKVPDAELILAVLRALPPSYDTAREVLRYTSTGKTFNMILPLLLSAQAQVNETDRRVTVVEPAAFSAHGAQKQGKQVDNRRCFNCNKRGHKAAQCPDPPKDKHNKGGNATAYGAWTECEAL